MASKILIARSSNASIWAGTFITFCFTALIPFPSLRGSYVPTFLILFYSASAAYIFAIFRLHRDRISLKLIFGFAIIFRLILVFTTPSLSDDIYRYIWDGHLINNGVNPYAFPVNSPLLDSFAIPLRTLVNHNWMASPYMPTSQLVFAIVERIFPQNISVFKVAAVVFDLSTGWLVLDILNKLGLPRRNVLIYLWNPLVIIEFSHSGHVDAMMISFMMLAFWFLVKENHQRVAFLSGSVLGLAAATLTKFLPILLLPIFWWRWGWKSRGIFSLIIFLTLLLFVPGAGWGLFGPLDGTGIFGATRIYVQGWNYNSSFYHWLEVWLSGFETAGAVPVDLVGKTPIYIAKSITAALLAIIVLLTAWLAWRNEKLDQRILRDRNLALIRLAILPLGAFLVLTATVHPWYVTMIVPFASFYFPKTIDSATIKLFFWPWIYFSIAVTLSYLTYIDPSNLRETTWVRLVEYIPFYGLLSWAFIHAIRESKKPQPIIV